MKDRAIEEVTIVRHLELSAASYRAKPLNSALKLFGAFTPLI